MLRSTFALVARMPCSLLSRTAAARCGTHITNKLSGKIPRLGRTFCSNNAGGNLAVVPGQEAVVKFSETQLTLGGDGKTLSVKFNDQSVNYELPDELKGTTLRRIRVLTVQTKTAIT